jgi:carbonic anhydrase
MLRVERVGRFASPSVAASVTRKLVHSRSAEAALARLVAGNARFVGGTARFPTVQKEVLASLAKRQNPYATILGCSDSRVPPELVFDAGFGELFTVRVAGNVVLPAVAGTLQYAGVHLATPLFVVLGHDRCGAVEAALAAKLRGVRQKSRIEVIIQSMLPSLADVNLALPAEERMRAAVEANVRWALRRIRESPEGRTRLAEGKTKLVGGIYELTAGRVRFFE